MDFDLEKDFEIFKPLLEKRPEIDLDQLKKDLGRYYLPFAKKLIELKKSKNSEAGMIVGISAIQGAGKTTQGEILETLMDFLGFQTVSLSIDDHYITHQELDELRKIDPRYIRRGVTHDISLAINNLEKLQELTEPVIIAGYDKGAYGGDGDRFAFVNPTEGLVIKLSIIGNGFRVNQVQFNDATIPLPENMGGLVPLDEKLIPKNLVEFLQNQTDVTIETKGDDQVNFEGSGSVTISKKDLPKGWKLVFKKPDFIFYDGWMLGARSVSDESVFDQNLPALETQDAKQFAKDINKKLTEYEILWSKIDFLNLLYVKNYQISIKWREQAEEALQKKGEGMTPEQIVDFVHYFWRSVHPAIQIKNLSEDKIHTQQVVIIGDDHSIGEISTPS